MFQDFREFAMRGNFVDMAVGIVIGAGFNEVVGSFVNNVLMPPIGLLVGNVDFSDLFLTLRGGSFETLEAAKAAGAVTLNYGLWVNSVVDFLITAFAVFLLVRQINRLRREEERTPEKPPAPSREQSLLAEIRDLLKERTA